MDRRLANVIFLQQFLEKISQLDHRSIAILALRLLAVNKQTLDEVGAQLNLTRERVRQLEHKLIRTIEPILADLRTMYRDELSANAPDAGVICMLNHVAPFGSRARERIGPGEIDFSLLGTLFDLYEVSDGVCFAPNKEAVTKKLTDLISEIHPYSLFHIEDLFTGAVISGPMSNKNFARALTILGFTQLAEGRWINSSNYVESAVALLAGEVELKSLVSLRDSIDPTISLKSFRQRLMQDVRFSFPDSTSVKLVEDGQIAERPTPISALIEEVVPADGAKIGLQEVIDYVKSKRTAADSSIRSFASRHPFSLERNFVYRTNEEIKRPKQQPCRTRNLFRLPNGWAIRLRVTAEHIRGSSITLPVSVVNAFDLQLRAPRLFDDRQSTEPLWLSWDGSQPKARSIRRNLTSIQANAGDEVMLVFHHDDFWVHQIPDPEQGGVEALASLFPDLFGKNVNVFLYEAFMCRELGGVPLIEAMKLRREYDLIARFEVDS